MVKRPNDSPQRGATSCGELTRLVPKVSGRLGGFLGGVYFPRAEGARVFLDEPGFGCVGAFGFTRYGALGWSIGRSRGSVIRSFVVG